MNNKIFKKIFLTFIFLMLFPIIGKAQNRVILEANKTDLECGDEVTIKASIDADTKLYALLATLSYDENVFEVIKENDFTSSPAWSEVIYNKENKKFGLINKSGEILDNLLEVTLKVKDDAHAGKTQITLNNISASDGKKNYYFSSKEVEVLVTKDSNNNVLENNQSESNIISSEDKVIKTFKLKPVLTFTIAITILLLVSLILIYALKLPVNSLVSKIMIICSIIFVSLTIGLSIVNNNKKDVNNDGIKDYEDAKEIIKYLIDLKGTQDSSDQPSQEQNNTSSNNNANSNNNDSNKEEEKEPEESEPPVTKPDDNQDQEKVPDTNGDGKVDVGDVAGSVTEANKRKYKVTLEERETTYYIEKGEVTLEFKTTVEPLEQVNEVVVDNVKYKVTRYSDYDAVVVKTPEKYGEHTFEISEAILDNGQAVKTDLKIKKDILKTKPYIDMFNVDDENKTFNFKLEDPDHAFIEGYLTVTDPEGQEVIKEDITENNHFSYDFKEGIIYKATVNAKYDLDSQIGEDNYYEDAIYIHTLSIGSNYNFKINNISITDALAKGEDPVISFDSTNRYNFEVEYIIVDGKEYNVTTIDNNHYTVALTNFAPLDFGRHELKIAKVVIKNMKAFELDKDYTMDSLVYNVLKEAPVVSDIKLSSSENKEITTSYHIIDNDETINKLTAVLVDSTNKQIAQKEIAKEDFNQDFTLSYSSNNAGFYKLKFMANYNLGTERHDYIDKNIGDEEILTQSDIKITDITVTNIFPTKNQKLYKVKIFLEVSEELQKKYNEFAGVTINGINYDGASNGLKSTEVSFTVPDEAGLITLRVDRVRLRKETYNSLVQDYFSVSNYITEIDVLKDKPKIDNLVIEDNYEEQKATLKFALVTDKGGLHKAYLQAGDIKKEIIEGFNEVTLDNLEIAKDFSIKFYADYDLDTNTLDKLENKNYVENDLIKEITYGLYNPELYDNITITKAEALSGRGNNYFDKFQKVMLKFEVEGLPKDLTIAKAIINNKEYNVTNTVDNFSFLAYESYNTSGLKNINLEEIILSNGKKVSLKEPVVFTAEVLKDKVSLESFNYKIEDNTLKLNISLNDGDNSLNKAWLEIYNEQNSLLTTIPYEENMEFNLTNETRYYLKFKADIDLDIEKNNNLNEFHDVTIFEELITLAENTVVLQDITDIFIYKYENDLVVLKDIIDYNDLKTNLDDYFLEIKMNNMPSIRSKITNVYELNGKLMVDLDYKNTINENNNLKKNVSLSIGTIKDGKVINETTLEYLIEFITNNPNATVKLTHDLNAQMLDNSSPYVFDVVFKGKFDGNGYIIKNLNKPLFRELDGATVENVGLYDGKLNSSSYQGLLANKATNSTIKDILVKNLIKTASPSESGSLIGYANKSTLENVRSLDFVLNANYNTQGVGGLIGKTDNSYITNAYAIGSISTNFNFIGGLIGNARNTEIKNSLTNVTLSGNDGVSCSLACVYSANITLNNNISLNNKGFKSGFTNNTNKLDNNYIIGLEPEKAINGLNYISESDINSDLFVNKLNFDKEIWSLENISINNIPIFKKDKTSNIKLSDDLVDYQESKETLYYNLKLLMPYYDSKKIVASSLNVLDHDLNNLKIKHILALDSNGSIVSYLTDSTVKNIVKIKIVFENNTYKDYNVYFESIYDFVANYRIPELNIDYCYKNYVINSNSQLVNNLTNYILSLKYEDNLDSLTPSLDSRIYKDFYNEVTKKEIKDLVLKYLANSNYTNTLNDEVINNYLEREIKKNQKLEKVVYVYNYFRRFYDVDINGIKLYDLILFNSNGYKNLNIDTIVDLYLNQESNFQTNRTSDVFANLLGNYTNSKNIPEFLEQVVNMVSTLDVATWYRDAFKGYIVEINIDNRNDIEYRLWNHIKTQDKNTNVNWFNYALPIITLPKDAAYIVSTPTQFIIGAQRTYITDPTNELEKKKLTDKIASYAERLKTYYTTTAGLLVDAKYLNNIHTIQIDKRYTYDLNGVLTFQNPNSTEEPFHKNFNEVIGQWAYNDYNAATANGAYIIWRVEGVMDGNLLPEYGDTYEYTYHTWSHETAHNMDARLFLKDYGRRFDAGGEDYADGNLTQSFGDGDIVMNLSRYFEDKALISVNLKPERIDTTSEIHDFYRKLFETLYIMDYLEGKAFLSLTSAEQARLAVQVSYPNANLYEIDSDMPYYRNYLNTVYQTISEDTISAMHLETINDLIQNKLVMYPTVIYSTITSNRYGGENIYKVRWYQPHNDYGRPDSYSIKWFAYEMLGYKGYDEGYIEYYSNRNSIKKEFAQLDDKGNYKYDKNNNKLMSTVDYKTDLMALRKITNDDNITFDTYKLNRFNEVEKNLSHIRYIDVNKYYNEFLKALKEDAKLVKETEEQALAKYPVVADEEQNNKNTTERNKLISNARKYTKSSEVRRSLYYNLKNSTNDFIEEVYDYNLDNGFTTLKETSEN